MKVRDVMLQTMAKKISWWQAVEILGISDRHMRPWRERYEELRYDGLFDRQAGEGVAETGAGGGGGAGAGTVPEPVFRSERERFHEKLQRDTAWLSASPG